MYHSINFTIGGETYNTWDSWRLIPYPRPSVSMPKHRSKFIDIPGMNGQMDISDILTGSPLYETRTGSWEFYISRRRFANGTTHHWTTTWRKVADAIHGKRGSVWLEDDPNYAYNGRFSLGNKFDVQKDYSKITIEYTLDPWPVERRTLSDEIGGWLWDPFNFEMNTIDDSVTPHQLVEKEYL